MTILREGLLEGQAVALSGVGLPGLAEALAGLGARVEPMPALDGADEERVGEWARGCAPLRALVYVADGGIDDLLAGAWDAVREVAVGTLIPAAGGKIVLVAPADDGAVAAGLENLARTLSVEWARFGVTAVAVLVGGSAADAEVTEAVCYLVSVAGDYFSGCRFELGRLADVGGEA